MAKPLDIYNITTQAAGPAGSLPLTGDYLKNSPSGHVFGMTMSAGMGWNPSELDRDQYLIMSTLAGARDESGEPVALGFHVGHFELDMQVRAAAETFAKLGTLPHATYVSDPCDGRTQGTTGMFSSLPYRNDAAIVFRRLIASLPERKGVMGIATCDKGLPATIMALVATRELPIILVPGGTTTPPTEGEDLAVVQSIGARYANNELSLERACRLGCSSCASKGGGCHFYGTAGTTQMVAEAMGLALPHSALAPSGQDIWLDIANRSAEALVALQTKGLTTADIITDKSIHNAMVMHAATGGSTNLLLHIPAIAHAAGLRQPTLDDWIDINRKVPRIVSVLPNGPVNHPTLRLFLAGGAPEVMLHMRELGLLHLDALTVTGRSLGEELDIWEHSERRQRVRQILITEEGVNPDDVIMTPAKAKARGMRSTVTFPVGNIAPEGSIIKSTAIASDKLDAQGVFKHTGTAKIFVSEASAAKAIKDGHIQAGDIMVVTCGGPLGTGMEETYQLTSALKHLSYGKHVSLITDARFSGVSTGACIGHVGPEALADGPIGKLKDGDVIAIEVDCNQLVGSVNFIGTVDHPLTPSEGAKVLASRDKNPDMTPHPLLPSDTKLWAALQSASGGTWKGCVYDVDTIIDLLTLGKQAKAAQEANAHTGSD